MKKSHKPQTIEKHIDTSNENKADTVNIKHLEYKKLHTIKQIIRPVLIKLGYFEYLNEICVAIQTTQILKKIGMQEKSLMFIYKVLRSKGYPILFTDLFEVEDFEEIRVVLQKTSSIFRNTKIPRIYYTNLVNRLSNFLKEKNAKLDCKFSVEEVVNLVAYKPKICSRILNILIGRRISRKAFETLELHQFCSFEGYKNFMYQYFK